MSTKNSLTTLLSDLLRYQTNGYEIITTLSEVFSSNSDTVSLDLQDKEGVIKTIKIPSFGALSKKINRLESNIERLSSLNDSSASLRLSDGKFRKILVSRLKKEAADISAINAPTTFNAKENWFFESFLNPLLYVTFDFSGQISTSTERVEVSRYVLNLDTDEKLRIFEENFKGNADIQFQDFYETIVDSNITFFKDQDVIDLPPRTVRYFGDFAVTDITDETVTEEVNGVVSTKRVLRLKLNTLTYNDRQSRFLGTQSLKIGDSLVVNADTPNTRYMIESIDASTRSVTVSLVEGFDRITIGSDVLSYYDEDESSVNVEVNVGFNEHTVIFIRPIDPDSKIAAINWSPGCAFYTNELTTLDENDEEILLSTYYQNSVIDFGAYLYSMSKEGIPPSIFGINPDAPTISADDFQVVKINEHRTESSSIENLRNLQADKVRVNSEIVSVDKKLKSLEKKVSTTKYLSKKVEDTDKNEMSKLINERENLSSRLGSIVDNINTVSTSENVFDLKPKYRLRGFFPIPEAKKTDRTGAQEVIQFLVRYRYVKKDGGANKPEQIEFIDNTGESRRGTFSSWEQYKTDIRTRVEDPDTGEITWEIEDVEDGDAVNINQIDLAISPGEGIEFQVKSISEAGWPANPKTSVWSDLVRVDFPDNLESIQDADEIVEAARRDRVRLDLENQLRSAGVYDHVASQFTQGDVTYKHDAKEIASGFFNDAGGNVSLFDKIQAIDRELSRLQTLIEKAKGKLVVRFIDDIGQEYPVQPNSKIKLFAGNYKDEVSNLPVKKGAIITKNYFIRMFNDAASTLELYSREFGTRYAKVTESYSEGENYDQADSDYNRIRRYDYVPLGLSNPDESEVTQYGFIRRYPEQSSQVLGQFLGVRYKSVDGTKNLYSSVGGQTYGVYDSRSITEGTSPFFATQTEDLEEVALQSVFDSLSASTNIGSTANGDFIWKGGTNGNWTIPVSDSLVQNNFANSIFVHISHPSISSWSDSSTTDTGVNEIVQDEVRNSVFAGIPVGSTGWNKQTALFYEGTGATADKYAKVGFEDSDQYLIGPKSVGAYLYLAPKDHELITVPGSDSLSFTTIEFGTKGSLVIPVIFQYRMTDYYGDGNTGIGNIKGDPNSNSRTNVTYTKTIGVDIYSNPTDKERFSFDVECTARYFSKSLSSKEGPLRTFENVVDDLLAQGVSITPNTSRDLGS